MRTTKRDSSGSRPALHSIKAAALLLAPALYEHRSARPPSLSLQGIARVESIQSRCDHKRDDQINRHGDRHHLHRRLRLIENCAGENLYEVWITNKHGKRGILDDV